MSKVYLNTLTIKEIIKRLKAGEVANCGEAIYRMIDGIIVKVDEKSTTLGVSIEIDKTDDFYFEQEEPFKIIETGFYKTRDGRRAYISTIEKYAYGVIDGESTVRDWHLNGRWAATDSDNVDIIAKWGNSKEK